MSIFLQHFLSKGGIPCAYTLHGLEPDNHYALYIGGIRSEGYLLVPHAFLPARQLIALSPPPLLSLSQLLC